ncbi:MAG: hypothetical protein OXH75_19605, partial [Acidobacteria bacterium]|nr:hypothetical protein [Acidobacteriota bacterium]
MADEVNSAVDGIISPRREHQAPVKLSTALSVSRRHAPAPTTTRGLLLRIPDQIDHRFRSKSITDSDPNR